MEGDVGGSIVVESGDDHRGCYRGMSGDSCIGDESTEYMDDEWGVYMWIS